LNNPLTGISTFAQLLLEETLSEEQSESVREIKREADRAVGVIRELLTFSRKTGPRLIAVDLNALVEHTVRLRAYSLQSAGIEVRTELDPVPPTAIGDDQRLQQVLLNLMVNAEYAMHRAQSRLLTIRTSRQTVGGIPRVVVDVIDTGTGMTPDVLPHIFEPFFTTKPAGVGTGLGLSVSYTIVEAHGGTIDASSSPGVGTTFTVALPEYVASTNGRTASPSAAVARTSGATARPTAAPQIDPSQPAAPAAPPGDARGARRPSVTKRPHD
jgi:signal transduction histidine kinase